MESRLGSTQFAHMFLPYGWVVYLRKEMIDRVAKQLGFGSDSHSLWVIGNSATALPPFW